MILVHDLRCADHPIRLLGRIRRDPAVRIIDGNLVEIACRDCRQQARRTDPGVSLVLHRFNVAGLLIETEVVRR